MKRDYEEMLDKMVFWNEQGKDYVMNALLEYNVKYLQTLESGVEQVVYSLALKRESTEDVSLKQECDDKIAEIADKVYLLDNLHMNKDCRICIFKSYSYEEARKKHIFGRKTEERRYYTAIFEIVMHSNKFKEQYDAKKEEKQNKKKAIGRIRPRKGSFKSIKIC